MSNVYLFKLKDNSAFKIGKSNNIIERFSTLSSLYEFDENIIEICCDSEQNAFMLESSLHKICNKHQNLQEFAGGTEFFDMIIYEKIINILVDICDVNDYTINGYDTYIEDLDDIDKGGINITMLRIGNMIKHRRLEVDYTQQQLATRLDCGLNTIKKLENGKSVNFKIVLCVMSFLKIIDDFLTFPECEYTNRKRATKKLRVFKIVNTINRQ